MNFLKSAVAGYESASYTTVKTFENGVEERIYPAQKWATTQLILAEKEYDEKKADMFWALYGYITGKNDKGISIAMTVPVSTKVTAAEDKKMCFQMGFYVPKQFQADPPAPTDDRVQIIERDLHVYTSTFSGYAKEEDYDKKLKELVEFLKSKGINVPLSDDSNEPIRFNVGYDSPAKFWNRKNEVWVLGA